MKLTVKEQERLIMFNVAEVSRRRWKRGVKLNYIEAMSIICDELLESPFADAASCRFLRYPEILRVQDIVT